MDQELYTRKDSLRLRDFDYSSHRVYFITTVVSKRLELFYDKQLAKSVIDCLLQLREKMKFNLYGYCLMPDHFHALIGIGQFESDLGKICAHSRVYQHVFIGITGKELFGSEVITIILSAMKKIFSNV